MVILLDLKATSVKRKSRGIVSAWGYVYEVSVMGLTKQYLRYVAAGNFNIICSPVCNVAHVVLQGCSGRYVAVAACEHVFVWDMRLSEKVFVYIYLI